MDDIELENLRHFKLAYRGDLTDLNELELSIKNVGLLQPLVVRPQADYFETIVGNRRYKACKNLGYKKVACYVMTLTDKDAFELSMIENLQRKSLSSTEEAMAYKSYIVNFGWGGLTELAKKIGKSASYVDKKIKLLDMPDEIKEAVSKSLLPESSATELLFLKDKSLQCEVARYSVVNKLSSKDIRKVIRNINDDGTIYKNDRIFLDREIIPSYQDEVRLIDKSITILRIALIRLARIIEDIGNDNWMLHELLMTHKYLLHNQIDTLIKQKMKF